ncbi:MAG: hypothetical protein H0W36_05760 [Gemmatimonadetes bacterium]|nr:hypothetical protein [Gemmatimonadota bacterium]
MFEGDPLLTAAHRARLRERGGSGIVRLVLEEGRRVARRDIVLPGGPPEP